jgi:hypothetical protein
MSNEPISQSVSRLQARKEAIENELAGIESRIHAIEQALYEGNSGAKEAKPSTGISERKPAASDGGKSERATNKGRKANRWFAAGEAASLMKRYVRTPMTASEIVKVLARAKGFDNGLTGVQAKRFQATAYMAVANAVKGGAARRLKDGRVRLA